MFSFFKKMFKADTTDYSRLVKEGALILDVRTKREYARGHIEGSINIPVDDLTKDIRDLKLKNSPIITCCASGSRSARAESILKSSGITKVYNGGGWQSLKQKIK